MIQIYNPSGKVVGYVEGGIYHKTINFKTGQMFQHPKYHGSIGISKSVLRQLVMNDVIKLDFLIVNFEDKTFRAIMTLSDFLKYSKEVFFEGQRNSDEQRICPLHYFTRVYLNQQALTL